MGNPTIFTNDAAITSRSAEVTGANWGTGGDWPAACSPGIGINEGGGALPDAATDPAGWNWTLLDQDGDARTPQVSQNIGGVGFVNRSTTDWPSSGGVEGKGTAAIRDVLNPANVNEQPDNNAPPVPQADMWLRTLAQGWTSGDPGP